jgi:small-conductance mechanosensitive channel
VQALIGFAALAQVGVEREDVEEDVRQLTELLVSIGRQVALIVAILAVLLVIRALIVRYVVRTVEDPKVWYRVRKTLNWVVTVLFVLTAVFALTLGGAGLASIVTYIGILSAGIAVALADMLRNLAGFFYITARRPFRVGDRVEIAGHAGDVVDVRAFRFSLLEIRNWVEADQSTGRIVHMPNGKILSEPLANFGAGFHWVWHEVAVLLTFESDWKRATALLEAILAEESPDVRSREAAEAIRRASKDYLISFTHLNPTVYLNVKDSGIQLTGRLLCDVRTRRGVTHRIWTALLEVIEAEASIELAYPTVRAFLADPVQVRSRAEDPDRTAAAPPGRVNDDPDGREEG